jgi:hypothetical protein
MVLEIQDSLKKPDTIVLAQLKLARRPKPKISTLP